jgi:hypothetical protein
MTQKARIKRDLWDGDGSDVPTHICASKGEIGELGPNNYWAFTIHLSGNRNIGVRADEVEIINHHEEAKVVPLDFQI